MGHAHHGGHGVPAAGVGVVDGVLGAAAGPGFPADGVVDWLYTGNDWLGSQRTVELKLFNVKCHLVEQWIRTNRNVEKAEIAAQRSPRSSYVGREIKRDTAAVMLNTAPATIT